MGFFRKGIVTLGNAITKVFGTPATSRGEDSVSNIVQILAGAHVAKETYRRDDSRLTLSQAYLRQLAKHDADSWAIINRIKTRIGRLPWAVVPDLGATQRELAAWEQRVALWLSPWAEGEAFPSLDASTIPLEIGGPLRSRLIGLSRGDKDSRKRARWAFDLAKADLEAGLAPMCSHAEDFLRHCNTDSDAPLETLIDMWVEDLLVLDGPSIAIRPNLEGSAYDMYAVRAHEVYPYAMTDGSRPQPPAPAYARKVDGRITREYVTDYRACEDSRGEIAMVRIVANPVGQGHWGMSPLEAAAFVIAGSLRADQFNFDKFSTNIPPGIIALGSSLTEEQVKQFRALFNSDVMGQVGGLNQFHFTNSDKEKIGVIPFNGITPNEMGYAEYRKWTLRAKCACFGISTQDVGEIADAKYETSSNQLRISSEGVDEVVRLLEQALTVALDRAFDTEGRIRFKLRRDDSIDTAEAATRDATLIDKGVLSIDEARAKRGMPSLPVGGDSHMIILKGQAMPLELVGTSVDLGEEVANDIEVDEEEEDDDANGDRPSDGESGGKGQQPGGGAVDGGAGVGNDATVDEKIEKSNSVSATLSPSREFNLARMRNGKRARQTVIGKQQKKISKKVKALARKALRGVRGLM